MKLDVHNMSVVFVLVVGLIELNNLIADKTSCVNETRLFNMPRLVFARSCSPTPKTTRRYLLLVT